MTDERLTPELHAAVRRIADAIVLSVPRHVVPLDDARALRGTLGALIEEREKLIAENERLRAELAASERDRLAGPRDAVDL